MVKFLLLEMGMLLSMKLVLLSLTPSIANEIHNYINNGTLADIKVFSYQVGLDIVGRFCGGALISNTFVLTAGHCIEPFDAEDIIAYLGSATIYKGEQREAVSVHIHGDFDPDSLRNDIAIVEIEHIDYTDNIRSIALPEILDHYYDYELERVVTSGWGKANRRPGISKQLLYVKIQVLNNDECADIYYDDSVTDTNICTFSDYGGSPCPGDSGGPLVHIDTSTLIGITSFGPMGNCTFGAVYTRVTSYLGWIRDVTGI